jgi:hypothetical protein
VLKKIIVWAVVIFIVYYLATEPTSAANVTHTWFGAAAAATTAICRFVLKL